MPVNIVLLADNLMFGGVNRYCLDLAVGLRAYADVTVSLLALGDRNPPWLLRAAAQCGVPVEVLPMRHAFDWQVIPVLRRLLCKRRVDILHSQSYRSSVSARLAVRVAGAPVRLVCTVHGAYQFKAATIRLRLFFGLDYLTLRWCDHIIPVSAATGRQIAPYCGGKPMTVIHNGVRLPDVPPMSARSAARRALSIPDQAWVVTFVGRLSPEKGVETLVDVARLTLSRTTDIVFLVVGDGAMRADIEGLARLFADRVFFVGAQQETSAFYQASDLLLLPSPMEGLPMVLLEAMAYGVPAIASNVGGIPEVISDGRNGFLTGPGNVEEIYQHIIQLRDDEPLRRAMTEQARATVANNFSLARMAGRTYQVYRSVMSEGR